MLVAASPVRPSWILAIVATLGSVALLSCLLAVCTRGRRLRSLGTEDWLLIVATLCVVGDVVVTVLRVQGKEWATAAEEDSDIATLVWVEALVQILGIGFVKLSVSVIALSRAVRNWHRHTILGYICLITLLVVFWFSSALLFSGPITVSWSTTSEPETIWELLYFVNSVLDVSTCLLLALLPLLILSTSPSRLNLANRLTLLTAYTITAAAIASASLRTYLLQTDWQTPNNHTNTPLLTLCTSIQLALGTLSASLLTLPPLLPSLPTPRWSRKSTSHSTSTSTSPRNYPSHTFASTDTVIRHPAPSLLTLRFHDTESNLDFDMATIHSTTNTHTHTRPPSRATHSRNVSDWSQFSGFTHYTTPSPSARQSARQSLRQSARQSARQSLHDAVPLPPTPTATATARRSRVVSVGELEARTRALAAGRGSERRALSGEGIGVAVTVGEAPGGEEMQELARLFGDRERAWGAGDGDERGAVGGGRE